MDFDCAVIGAGVVGLACARELALKGLSVVVIERHGRNGQETSSRNSCVIHAGMYYPEGSIKAELCFRANQRLYQYCEEKKIPHRKIGKFIVAVNPQEEESLTKIFERGLANGVEGLSLVSGKTVMEKNPAVVASCAIHSRETGIVDPHGLMDALEHDAAEHGAVLAYAHELVAVEKKRRLSFDCTLRPRTAQYRDSWCGQCCRIGCRPCGRACWDRRGKIGLHTPLLPWALLFTPAQKIAAFS